MVYEFGTRTKNPALSQLAVVSPDSQSHRLQALGKVIEPLYASVSPLSKWWSLC